MQQAEYFSEASIHQLENGKRVAIELGFDHLAEMYRVEIHRRMNHLH